MNIAKKFAVGVVAFSTAATLSGVASFVPVAGAATVAELEAMIANLTAQLAALTGGTTTTTGGACNAVLTGSADMTVGSSGAAVTALQDYLTGTGHFTFAGGSTGYFGGVTQTALASWQGANGVSPASGYWGPISRAAYGSMCDGTTTTTGGSTTLSGNAGSVEQYDLDGSLNNEEVGEDEDDVEIFGLEIEADDGSDLNITALKLDFDQGTAGSDFDDYAKEVTVWFDGEKVAEKDADKFDDDNGYSSTVSLDEDAVIEAGEKDDIIVAVSGINNLDSADAGDTWTLDVTSVRFMDGQGALISEDPGTAAVTFSFENLTTAQNTEVKFAEDDDAVNEAHVIDADDNNDTDNEPLLSFTIEVEGDGDVVLDDLPVNLDSVTGGTGDLDSIISTLYLYMDGDKVGSESVTDAGSNDDETITFDDLDLDLESEETYDFLVTGDLNPVDGTIVVAGDTISAQISATERAAADIDDEKGDNIAAGDRTGTAIGEAHGIFAEGILVEFVGEADGTPNITRSDTTGINETVEFSLEFDVTAFGDDMWVDQTCVVGTTGTDVDAIEVSLDGDANGDNTSCTNVASDGDKGTDGYEVKDGQTERFTVNILGDAGEAGGAGSSVTFTARIVGIGYNVDTDAVGDTVYAFNMTDYESDAVTVFDR